jgi:hypothetical protein
MPDSLPAPSSTAATQLSSISVGSVDLTPKQLNVTNFVDLLLKTYGPLGAFLGCALYYIVSKDHVIAEKDRQLMSQQSAILDISKVQTETFVKASNSQVQFAQAVEANTRAVQQLVAVMESHNNR